MDKKKAIAKFALLFSHLFYFILSSKLPWLLFGFFCLLICVFAWRVSGFHCMFFLLDDPAYPSKGNASRLFCSNYLLIHILRYKDLGCVVR